jgi:hypothetical protein
MEWKATQIDDTWAIVEDCGGGKELARGLTEESATQIAAAHNADLDDVLEDANYRDDD